MTEAQLRLIDLIDDMSVGKDVFFRMVRSARDVMTYDVKTLALDDTMETCLRFMKDNKVRHVPVVDRPTGQEERPYLVGIASERDVFREICLQGGGPGEKHAKPKGLRRSLAQVVTRHPKCASPETPIRDLLESMLGNRLDMVPVVEGDDLVGTVTAGDIVKLFVRLGALRQLCEAARESTQLANRSPLDGEESSPLSAVPQGVRDIMTEEVVCLTPQDDLAKALEVMQEGTFRHIPIVDEEGKLVGVVSDRDVLRHLPFARGRRRREGEGFRSSLFAVDPDDRRLKLPLEQIMTEKVVRVSRSCSICDAARTLHRMRASCLPVVDEEENIRGIVTVTDLMRALLAAYELVEQAQC